jgi:hypothetical protein
MKYATVMIAVFGLATAGCDQQGSAPPSTKSGTKVDVEAPGVNVKVRGQQPDGERKADVDVKVRKKGE